MGEAPVLDSFTGWLKWAAYLALFIGVLYPICRAGAYRLGPMIRRRYGLPPEPPPPVEMMPRRYAWPLKIAQLWLFIVVYVFIVTNIETNPDERLAMSAIAAIVAYAATFWLYLIAERAVTFSRWARSRGSSARARALGSGAGAHRMEQPASRYID